MSKISTLIIAFTWLCPGLIFGKSDLRIVPTLVALAPNHQLMVSYREPCSGTFKGFVVREIDEATEIGALFAVERFRCTGLGGLKVRALPGLAYQSIDQVFSMEPSQFQEKLILTEAEAHHYASSTTLGTSSSFETTYQSQCGYLVGKVFSTTKGKLKVSVLEERPSHTRSRECQRVLSTTSLEYFSSFDLANLTTPEPSKKSNRGYQIKFAKIYPSTLSTESGLSFRYRRLCNEAPIGPMHRPLKDGRAKIGMLVAHYPNLTCPPNGPKVFSSPYTDPEIQLLPHIKISTIVPPKGDYGIKLTSPISTIQDDRLQLRHLSGCHRTVGTATVRKNSRHHIALVHLEKKEQAFKPCKKPLKELVYKTRGISINSEKSLLPLVLKKP